MRSHVALRPLVLALAGGFVFTGCYGLSQPSFDPGDHRDVLKSIVRRGIVVTEPLTTNENWTALQPGEFVTFVEGCPQPRAEAPQVRPAA